MPPNNAFERTAEERGFGHRWRAAAQRGRWGSQMARVFFVVILVLLALPAAHAAFNTYEFYDVKRCARYVVTDEPLGGTAAYEALMAKLKPNEAVWNMEDGDDLRLGICREDFSPPYRFSCRKESHNNFPLAGATYKAVADGKGNFIRHECESGCGPGVPKILYSPGYEPEGTEPSVLEHARAHKRFRKVCPEGGARPN